MNHYLVYLHPRFDVSYDNIKSVMDEAKDWYRLSDTTWILYSRRNADFWHSRLKPLAVDGGNVLICRLDMTDRHGWMGKYFWNWLLKHSEQDARAEEEAAA